MLALVAVLPTTMPPDSMVLVPDSVTTEATAVLNRRLWKDEPEAGVSVARVALTFRPVVKVSLVYVGAARPVLPPAMKSLPFRIAPTRIGLVAPITLLPLAIVGALVKLT